MDKINKYFATLRIDIEPYQIGNPNPRKLKLKSVSIPNIWKLVDDEIVNLNVDELNEICYEDKEITFVTQKSQFHEGFSKTFRNENGFTVRQMFDNVHDFEIEARPLSKWFGGIDTHHIIFEGFNKINGKDNHYTIYWGL